MKLTDNQIRYIKDRQIAFGRRKNFIAPIADLVLEMILQIDRHQ